MTPNESVVIPGNIHYFQFFLSQTQQVLHQCKVGRGHGTKVTNLSIVNLSHFFMVSLCVLEVVV